MSEPFVNNSSEPAGSPQAPRFPFVNLAHAAVLESSLRTLPPDFMYRFRVVPFSLDKYSHIASIACANPDDPELPVHLAEHFPGFNISLYQADPEAIARLIAHISPPIALPAPPTDAQNPDFQAHRAASDPEPVQEAASDFMPLLESEAVPEQGLRAAAELENPILHSENQPQEQEQAKSEEVPETGVAQRVVLFVTQSGKISQHLMFALSAERLTPKVVSNADAALVEIESKSVECVFVEKSLRSRYEPMLIKLRAEHPGLTIRFFTTEASVLLNATSEDLNLDLFQKNLQLLRQLSSGENSATAHHAATVARFADAICARLNFPNHVRQAVATSAFLHNLAEGSLASADGFDRADIIGLSAGRLANWDYPPLVIYLLRSMYHEILTDARNSISVDRLAGAVLTAADCFAHAWPDLSGISARNLDQVEKSLREQVGPCVTPEIVEALIDSVCDELTAQMLRHAPFRVQVLVSRGTLSPGLDAALHGASFTVDVTNSIDDCARFCRRYNPKVLVIRDSGSVQDVYDIIIGLAVRGVALDRVSTVMLLEREALVEATRLLRHGVEDILPHDADPLAIRAKLERIHTRIDDSAKERLAVLRDLGTHGTLEDMNLIDLLEVWRSNKRPVCISVSAHGTQLTVYVDRGKILYAECDDRTGADAILKGIAWRKGAWSIDTVDSADLPSPNVDQDIDAVLLDACVRFDKASLLERV